VASLDQTVEDGDAAWRQRRENDIPPNGRSEHPAEQHDKARDEEARQAAERRAARIRRESKQARQDRKSDPLAALAEDARSDPAKSGRTATNGHKDRRLAIGQLIPPGLGAKRQRRRGLRLLSSESISAAMKFRVGAFSARVRPPGDDKISGSAESGRFDLL
jgi:hypothetical protein